MFLKPEFSKLKDKPPVPRTSVLAQNDDLEVKTNASDDMPCFFCNVKTGGPSGSHIIQYFACKKIVDSTPAERFRVLRSKGLCHQCLYPGARQKEGKHANGKCRSYYVCKQESHNKYSLQETCVGVPRAQAIR